MSLRDNIGDSSDYVKKFLLSAKQMNLTNKKHWLEKLLDSDRFLYRNSLEGDSHTIRSAEKKRTIKTQLFQLIDVFNRKYGSDWDIHLEYEFIGGKTRFEIFFVIRYEHIIISNSEDRSRELYELFVVLPISWNSNMNCIYISEVLGTRYSIAHDEWFTGYLHSHLGSVDRINSFSRGAYLKTFCLGSSELSELNMELSTEFDETRFELMLYTIDSYVAWESLEGGPYISMDKITLQSPNSRLNDISDSYCATLYNYLFEIQHL